MDDITVRLKDLPEEAVIAMTLAVLEMGVQSSRHRQDAFNTARYAYERYGHFIPLPEPELCEEEAIRSAGKNLVKFGHKWGPENREFRYELGGWRRTLKRYGVAA
ncbi:hypothetical protein [Streptomyces sp. NPDC058644]|uniref:hypothetical protein n=1 Tax=unclassified Streptomyces TaxID=2593676 RepID=UPI00364FA679